MSAHEYRIDRFAKSWVDTAVSQSQGVLLDAIDVTPKSLNTTRIFVVQDYDIIYSRDGFLIISPSFHLKIHQQR